MISTNLPEFSALSLFLAMPNISPKSVATTFPHPLLTPIIGRPTYQTLAAIHLKLNANAASIFSNRGDGIHGLLALSVSPKIYLSTTGMAFPHLSTQAYTQSTSTQRLPPPKSHTRLENTIRFVRSGRNMSLLTSLWKINLSMQLIIYTKSLNYIWT